MGRRGGLEMEMEMDIVSPAAKFEPPAAAHHSGHVQYLCLNSPEHHRRHSCVPALFTTHLLGILDCPGLCSCTYRVETISGGLGIFHHRAHDGLQCHSTSLATSSAEYWPTSRSCIENAFDAEHTAPCGRHWSFRPGKMAAMERYNSSGRFSTSTCLGRRSGM